MPGTRWRSGGELNRPFAGSWPCRAARAQQRLRIRSEPIDHQRDFRARPLAHAGADRLGCRRHLEEGRMLPDVRYAKSGGIRIAYQVVGTGPLDLVFVPGFISNLDHYWDDPAAARFLSRLASF